VRIECVGVRHGRPQITCQVLYNFLHYTITTTCSPMTNTGKKTPATVGNELLMALAMNYRDSKITPHSHTSIHTLTLNTINTIRVRKILGVLQLVTISYWTLSSLSSSSIGIFLQVMLANNWLRAPLCVS